MTAPPPNPADPSPGSDRLPGGISARAMSCLKSAYEEGLPLRDGAPATSIPELGLVEPDQFAISICDTAGRVQSIGDSETRFTIQSIAKALLYGRALERFGSETLNLSVGVEPSGKVFDSMIRPEHGTQRPQNAMVNAGAIVVSGLLQESAGNAPHADFLEFLGSCIGDRTPEIDESVYRSEMTHGSKNRAIAYQMRHNGMLLGDVEPALQHYFRACSVSIDCKELAQIAAMLAAGGVQPLTGVRVLPERVVTQVLAVMATCGMYEASGAWAVKVGLPAKSGISGGIIAVAPGRFGLAAFCPRLDQSGNSVRGQRAIRHISHELDLHGFAPRTRRAPQRALQLEQVIDEIHEQLSERRVAEDDPAPLAIAVHTVEGEEHVVGDSELTFPIQSAVNPFAYAVALAAHGPSKVHRVVGVEPSGNSFASVYVDPRTGVPYNPLGSTGAIAVASLFPKGKPSQRLAILAERLGAFGGVAPLKLDQPTLKHEVEHGDHNRSIAHFLRSHQVIEDVDAALSLYFQQCSLLVTTRALARMGATLAAGGNPPCPGPGVIDPIDARRVLAQMYTCGMHDRSGRFAFDVGIPAKSGISGGIVGAVPGRLGVAVYAPGVDAMGCSVVGAEAFRLLATRLGLRQPQD